MFSELMIEVGSERLMEIMPQGPTLWYKDKYLHPDELRRRTPPEGMNFAEWCLLLKFGRVSKLRPIPLSDKKGGFFQFGLPDRLLAQLHSIDCGLGSDWVLPEAVLQPGARNEYIVSTLMQEAITSSQLEGAVTTRQVAKEMLRTGRPPRDKSERMILNNYRTMQRIMDLREQDLTPELVFELHRRVTEGTWEKTDAAGRFRLGNEEIKVTDMEGTVFHDPPAAEELPDRMAQMCAFANRLTPNYFVHPVVRAILLHFWLAYDHPFVDGNGRTARALFYWSMLRENFRLFEFISISQILLRAPTQYYMAFLYSETDENDLTYFILHQADVIHDAVQALHKYVDQRKAVLAAGERRLKGIQGLNYRQQALLTHALREPRARYSIEGHRRSHDIVYQTARTDLLDLVGRGLLVVSKEGRPWIFRTPGDLDQKLSGLAASPSPASGAGPESLPLNFSGGEGP